MASEAFEFGHAAAAGLALPSAGPIRPTRKLAVWQAARRSRASSKLLD